MEVDAHSGRCTFAPLAASALPAVGGELLLVQLVGEPRVGDRGLALERQGLRRADLRPAACRPRCPPGTRRRTPPSAIVEMSCPFAAACSRPAMKASMTSP